MECVRAASDQRSFKLFKILQFSALISPAQICLNPGRCTLVLLKDFMKKLKLLLALLGCALLLMTSCQEGLDTMTYGDLKVGVLDVSTGRTTDLSDLETSPVIGHSTTFVDMTALTILL